MFTLYGYHVNENDRKIKKPGASQDQKRPVMDTFRCGPYGYFDGTDGKCKLDLAVVPFYRAMCYNQASRIRILNDCANTLIYPGETDFINIYCAPFARITVDSCSNGKLFMFGGPGVFSVNGFQPQWEPDVENMRLGISCLINRFTDAFKEVRSYLSSSEFAPSSTTYTNSLTCAQRIHTEFQNEPTGTTTYTFPIDITDPNGATKTVVSGLSLYRFSDYGMYEYPYSWFVKCAMMVGQNPTDQSVDCLPWNHRFEISEASTQKGTTTWDFLSR